MPPAEQPEPNEQLLTRYLLGTLSEEEKERLDERSITDDEFATRLDIAEHELVDAFLRDELAGDALQRFKSLYLASAKRVEKVEFARALQQFTERGGSAEFERSKFGTEAKHRGASERSSFRGWLTVPRMGGQWAFAGSAVVMALASGYLLLENKRLRDTGSAMYARQADVQQQSQQLQRQLDDEKSANAGLAKELENLRGTKAGTDLLKAAAVLLMPVTRGTAQPITLSISTASEILPLRLRLEIDDYPHYQAVLRDPASNRVAWRSGALQVEKNLKRKEIVIGLPRPLLRDQTYSLELNGLPTTGAPELASNYFFRIELR